MNTVVQRDLITAADLNGEIVGEEMLNNRI